MSRRPLGNLAMSGSRPTQSRESFLVTTASSFFRKDISVHDILKLSMAQQLKNWLYDPKYSFADNLKYGPFGDFDKKSAYKNVGEPQYDFFGTKVYSPFGIAAGPLPQAKFVKSALDKGYDI